MQQCRLTVALTHSGFCMPTHGQCFLPVSGAPIRPDRNLPVPGLVVIARHVPRDTRSRIPQSRHLADHIGNRHGVVDVGPSIGATSFREDQDIRHGEEEATQVLHGAIGVGKGGVLNQHKRRHSKSHVTHGRERNTDGLPAVSATFRRFIL